MSTENVNKLTQSGKVSLVKPCRAWYMLGWRSQILASDNVIVIMCSCSGSGLVHGRHHRHGAKLGGSPRPLPARHGGPDPRHHHHARRGLLKIQIHGHRSRDVSMPQVDLFALLDMYFENSTYNVGGRSRLLNINRRRPRRPIL